MACAEFSFHVPSLEELAGVMQKGLKDNFADVQVSVVDCPDLTKEPFTFPVKGICGKTRIAEVGGVPYLLPLVNQKKVYDLNKIAKEIKLPGAFILGAGAGPFQTLGFNSEVIEVKAKRRTGPLNFVTCMRQTLEKHYGNKPIGMGGTFIIQKGKVKSHVMPAEFSSCPLNSDEEVNKWLHFYEMKAPLVCLPVFVSRDPKLPCSQKEVPESFQMLQERKKIREMGKLRKLALEELRNQHGEQKLPRDSPSFSPENQEKEPHVTTWRKVSLLAGCGGSCL
ncbi:ester hydrolase C11orf54 homolog isoform X7 [Pongo pygmaeus]|uniref:ester hydrolase C11orf54 homolog isoform X7 n=1 Tax=Pongo pygmaeus TaxID=9600 RepID=UPI00300D77B3